VIHHDDYNAEVDISKSEQVIPTKGDLVQCIGEVIEEVKSKI
jgi:hypothetical protein